MTEENPRQTTQGFSPARLLREPIVYFLAAGAALFIAYSYLEEDASAETDTLTIQITADDIRQMAIAWVAQGRPPLTRAEAEALTQQKIDEEVLYREGMALGLDRDDEIIKRRIVQKMDFLAADVAAIEMPGREDLRAWFERNAERFTSPPRISFRQLYFSPDKRGGAVRQDASVALAHLQNAAASSVDLSSLADRFILREFYSDATPNQVLREFGPGFATAIFDLPTEVWLGPVESGYGWHLVRVEEIEPPRIPAFEQVEPEVRTAWLENRHREIKQEVLEGMRSRYEIEVAPFEEITLDDLDAADAE